MPTYEYVCKSCGEHLDVVQSFKDEPLTTCPACGGALRKVFGSIGIAFKGSGFYRTDNRSTSATRSETSSKPSGESTSGTKGDSSSGTKDSSSGTKGDSSSGTKGDSSSGGKGGKGESKAAKSA